MAVAEQGVPKATRWKLRCAAIAWAVVALGEPAHAQASSRLTMQGPAENAATAPIRDSLGRPCLDVEAAARAQIVNPETMDHLVSIKNNCAKSFKLKVCYFNSESCREVDLQPYKRVDTILGSMRGSSYFRYTISQK
ncbi:MAG: hypothetical protein JWQ94_1080 [Tardiphaga sp.]|jgi:hypothetical protein|nr:hypothetical protein [Tardiphaga sp.]